MPKLPADLVIRPMRRPEEAELAAAMIVSTEPWITLRRDKATVMKALLNSTREVYVTETGGQVVGVLILFLDGLLNGYIQTITVRPDWRCSGLGTRLILFAEERIFQQSPNVFLCVSSFNQHAQRLYARLGYEHVGTLKDFAVRGHDEYLLRKTRGPLLP